MVVTIDVAVFCLCWFFLIYHLSLLAYDHLRVTRWLLSNQVSYSNKTRRKQKKSPNGHFPNAYLSFFREKYHSHKHNNSLPLITHLPKQTDMTIHKRIYGKEGYDNDCLSLTRIYPLKLNASLLKEINTFLQTKHKSLEGFFIRALWKNLVCHKHLRIWHSTVVVSMLVNFLTSPMMSLRKTERIRVSGSIKFLHVSCLSFCSFIYSQLRETNLEEKNNNK